MGRPETTIVDVTRPIFGKAARDGELSDPYIPIYRGHGDSMSKKNTCEQSHVL